MPDKVLFLDFDGVLHPTSHRSVLFSQMNLLEEALGNEVCQIVISSSWRFHMDLATLRGKFSNNMQERILGVTGDPYIGSYARFHEINAYAQEQGIDDWRALDDSFWEFPKGCDQLIRCNPNTGMSSAEVNLVKSWLASTV
jgi:hypothetical protein